MCTRGFRWTITCDRFLHISLVLYLYLFCSEFSSTGENHNGVCGFRTTMRYTQSELCALRPSRNMECLKQEQCERILDLGLKSVFRGYRGKPSWNLYSTIPQDRKLKT